MNSDSIETKLKEELFNDVNYSLTDDELLCEEQYKQFCDTNLLKMLRNMRRKLDSFSDYYEQSLGEELDEKKIEKYLAGFEKVKGSYITLDFLEKQLRQKSLQHLRLRVILRSILMSWQNNTVKITRIKQHVIGVINRTKYEKAIDYYNRRYAGFRKSLGGY